MAVAAVAASREDTEHDDVTVAERATSQVVDCCQIKNCCQVLFHTVDKFSRYGTIEWNIQLIGIKTTFIKI